MRRSLGGLVLAAGLGAATLLLAAGAAVVPELRSRRRRAFPAPPAPGPAAASAREPRARAVAPRPMRAAALFAGWTAAGAAGALLLVLGGSWLAGYRSFTVMSGSMEPAIATGDVVVNRPIAPLDARPGDVVTFRDPGGGGHFITHRVREVRAGGSTVTFVTKGDANTSTERWSVPATGEIGRVDYRLPGLGYALFWAGGRWAKLALITAPALLLGAFALAGIWRSEETRAVPG